MEPTLFDRARALLSAGFAGLAAIPLAEVTARAQCAGEPTVFIGQGQFDKNPMPLPSSLYSFATTSLPSGTRFTSLTIGPLDASNPFMEEPPPDPPPSSTYFVISIHVPIECAIPVGSRGVGQYSFFASLGPPPPPPPPPLARAGQDSFSSQAAAGQLVAGTDGLYGGAFVEGVEVETLEGVDIVPSSLTTTSSGGWSGQILTPKFQLGGDSGYLRLNLFCVWSDLSPGKTLTITTSFENTEIELLTPLRMSCPGDADGNSTVNFADVTEVLTYFLFNCP